MKIALKILGWTVLGIIGTLLLLFYYSTSEPSKGWEWFWWLVILIPLGTTLNELHKEMREYRSAVLGQLVQIRENTERGENLMREIADLLASQQNLSPFRHLDRN